MACLGPAFQPEKPAAAPVPGRPRRSKHLTPRKGIVLGKEPSFEKPPCVIPADCKALDSSLDENRTVLDTGFPYIDFIQRNDEGKPETRVPYAIGEPETQLRRRELSKTEARKARRKSHIHANMKAAGFQTMGLDLALDKAEVYYQRKLKQADCNPGILKDYGCWLHENERVIEAERMFKKALLIDRRDVDVLCAYAALLWDTGKHSRAEDMYRMGLTFEPKHLPCLLNHGLALFSKGDHVASLQRFRKAVEVDPQHEQALLGVAVTLEKIGRTLNEEIDALYNQILSINSNSFDALHSYAVFLKNKEGRHYEAQEYYQRALAIRPHDVHALCSYGVLLTEAAGQDPSAFGRAQLCFQQALLIQPRNPDALYSYAVLLSAWHQADVAAAAQAKPPTVADSSHPGAMPADPVHEDVTVPLQPTEASVHESPWSPAVGGYLDPDTPGGGYPIGGAVTVGNEAETLGGEADDAPSSSLQHGPDSEAEPPSQPEPEQARQDTSTRESSREPHSSPRIARRPSSATATPSVSPSPNERQHHHQPQHFPPPPHPPHPQDSSLPLPAVPHARTSSRGHGGGAVPGGGAITPWQGTPMRDNAHAPRPSSSGLFPVLSQEAARRPFTPRDTAAPEPTSRRGAPRHAAPPAARERRGSVGFGGGRPGVAESEALFRRALAVLPDDPDALCAFAIFTHKVRAPAAATPAARHTALQEAEKLYRRALKADPQHALARHGTGEMRVGGVRLGAAPNKRRARGTAVAHTTGEGGG